MCSSVVPNRTTRTAKWPKVYRLIDPRPAGTTRTGAWLRKVLPPFGSCDLDAYNIVEDESNDVVLEIVNLRADISFVLDPSGKLIVRTERMSTEAEEDVPPFKPWGRLDKFMRNDWLAYSLIDGSGNVRGIYKGHVPKRFIYRGPDIYLTFQSITYILATPFAFGKSRRRWTILANDREIGFAIPWNQVPEIYLSEQDHLLAAVCLILAQKKYDYMYSPGGV